MKTIKSLFFFIHLIFAINSFSQNIIVTYKQAFKKQNDTSSNKIDFYEDVSYELFISKGREAIFKIADRMDNDNSNDKMKNLIIKIGSNLVFYKNIVSKEKLTLLKAFGSQSIVVTEPLNLYDWKISNISKKINNYICYRATAEKIEINPLTKKKNIKKIIVWFTPDISVPFGPFGFDNLPGLVLESYADNFYFVASNIKFLDKAISIVKPVGTKKMTKKEYDTFIAEKFNTIKVNN